MLLLSIPVVLSCSLTIHMKATEQYVPVLLFIMQFKVVVVAEFCDLLKPLITILRPVQSSGLRRTKKLLELTDFTHSSSEALIYSLRKSQDGPRKRGYHARDQLQSMGCVLSVTVPHTKI